jgi:hypothetical protein
VAERSTLNTGDLAPKLRETLSRPLRGLAPVLDVVTAFVNATPTQ